MLLSRNTEDNKKFDVILNMEIIEHVDDIDYFIKKALNY